VGDELPLEFQLSLKRHLRQVEVIIDRDAANVGHELDEPVLGRELRR
jgi:hypothetical protein